MQSFPTTLRERIFEVTGWKVELLRHLSAMGKADGSPMLLITGKAGCGKTLLAECLRDPCVVENGYVLTVQFDHLMLPIPYDALVTAFTEFTSMVLERGEDEVSRICTAIRAELGDNTFVLQTIIPTLDRILGPVDNERPMSVAKGMTRRFVHDFRMFIRAVCSVRAPLVLVLDNMHYADKCSLDLLCSWRDDENLKGLFLVGTCDTSDLSNMPHLSSLFRRIEDGTGTSITEMHCTDLSESNLMSLGTHFVPSIDTDDRRAQSIGALLYAKTKGNVLYLDILGHWLETECLVTRTSDGRWTFDVDEVKEHLKGHAASDLLLLALSTLPKHRLHLVKTLCCLGSAVDQHVLRLVAPDGEVSDPEMVGLLGSMGDLRKEFMLQSNESRQIIYDWISLEEKKSLHLTIGRRLLRCLDEENVERRLFLALSQLYLSRPLNMKDKEIAGIATLSLQAAQKAAKLSTFRIACQYLYFGIELLGPKCWESQYTLSLALHNALAEMLLCTTSFEKMNETVDLVISKATDPRDMMQAYSTRIYYLGVVSRQQEALETGLEAMNLLGESFPRRFLKVYVMKEFARVSRRLSKMSEEQIFRIPPAEDENKLACMRILQLMLIYALLDENHSELAALIELRLMKMTLQHGMSVFAPIAFCAYGLIHVHVHDDWYGGYRYGEIALRLLEKYGTVEYLPRVYVLFYANLYPLRKHFRGSIEPLKLATEIGIQTGDFETVGLCASSYTAALLQSCAHLDIVVRHYEENQRYLLANGQQAVLDVMLPVMEIAYRYIGKSPNPLATKGVLFDFDVALREATEKGHGLARSVLLGLQSIIAFVFNDYDAALRLLPTHKDLKNYISAVDYFHLKFFNGLTMIASARTGKHRVTTRVLKRIAKQLNRFAVVCPENFLAKAYLLEAEIESLQGRHLLAYAKYASSISMAAHFQFSFFHALANELAAHHFVRLAQLETARSYFEDACCSYEKWGGLAKLTQLQAQVHSIYGKVRP